MPVKHPVPLMAIVPSSKEFGEKPAATMLDPSVAFKTNCSVHINSVALARRVHSPRLYMPSSKAPS